MKPTRFNVVIREEYACWIARCMDSSVEARGDTIEGALYNLKEALELHYEAVWR